MKLFKTPISTPLLTIIVAAVVFLLVQFFGLFLQTANKNIQNYYKVKSGVASDEIIVVEIDEDTLSRLGRFPFSRDKYAPVITHLHDAGAAVIGFDIIFADTSDAEADTAFSEAIRSAGNVVLGVFLSPSGAIEKPLDIFADYALGLGYFHPIVNPRNNTVYSLSPAKEFRSGERYDHFSMVLLKAYYSYIYGQDYLSYASQDEASYSVTPNIKVPLSMPGRNEMLIHFIDAAGFSRVSFYDVYEERNFDVLKEKVDFKDKIVMIGATAKGIKDVFTTPNGIDYGVYVHANAVNTVLEKTFFNYFNIPLEKILIFLLIVLSVYFNLSRSSYILILSNIAIAVIFLIIFPLLIATFTISLLNYPAEIILGLIFSLAISNIAKYMLENRSKIKLNTALSEYVSKDIAEEILSGEGNVNLNGEKKKIGIFFSDIAGFTTISEKFSPEQLVEFLREYLGEMSNIIMDQRGFINKYEGDAIMGLWGVFGHETTSSFDCCMAALKQQERLRELNSLWKEKYKEELRVRMGMHVGEAIIGNIGAKGRKMEFTALGDSVNLGSRLEGVNKFYGTYLCVSESIYEEVKEQFEFRYLDKIRVKGKEIPVNIYELLSVKDGLDVRKADIMEKFATALEFYFLRKFEDARTILEPLVVLGDAPSRVFLERCKMYAAQSPTDDWDGVWTMEEK